MDERQFKMLLEAGLALLYTRDKDLLDKMFNINERTITHRLALHFT